MSALIRRSSGTMARGFTVSAGLLAVSLGVGLGPAASLTPPSSASLGLAFIREGAVWLREPGGRQRRITQTDQCEGLSASAQGRLAWTSRERDGSVFVLDSLRSVPRRVCSVAYAGTPCWLPGERSLLTTRQALHSDASDEGLWRVNLDTGRVRQVVPPTDADASMFTLGRLSPSGTRAVFTGFITGWSQVTVLDLKLGRSWAAPGAAGVHGLGDVAWLDDDRLLIAGTAERIQEPGIGGIRVYDLRTRKTAPWLFSPTTCVAQLARSPRGGQFAVVLGGKVGRPGGSVGIVEALPRPRLVRKLRLPGDAWISEFSRDGRKLLVLSGDLEARKADAWEVDVATGARRRLVRNVSEAVWIR